MTASLQPFEGGGALLPPGGKVRIQTLDEGGKFGVLVDGGLDGGLLHGEIQVAGARAIFCCLAVQEFGYTGKDAGTASGLGSAGVCLAVQRGENLLQNGPTLREKIDGAWNLES